MTKAPNTQYGADVVLEPTIGGYNVWARDTVLASITPEGYAFIIAGIASQQCSIYNAATGQWIAGDVGQLDDDCFFDETPGEGYAYRNYAGQGA